MTDKIKAVVIGASGYTGAELVRLLKMHPKAEIVALVANSNAGKEMRDLYPQFTASNLPKLSEIEDVNFADVDVAFTCLPHGASQRIIAELYSKYPNLKIIDLSADYRIKDVDVYAKWYGAKHIAPDLQKDAVYGLTEIYREDIKTARLVACPGCYPTSMLLPLIPLLKEGVIKKENIIIDSKTGISGAGRKASIGNLFCEVEGNIQPYGLTGHRHISEVEQELTIAKNEDLQIIFTPQVVPMSRGILSNIYVDLESGKSVGDIKSAWSKHLNTDDCSFVKVPDVVPTTKQVVGSNIVHINAYENRVKGKVTIVCAIDNLLKGASGQAVQNMNLMFGFTECEGLQQIPVFP